MPEIKEILNDLDLKVRKRYMGYEDEKPVSLLKWSSDKYEYLPECIKKKKQLVYKYEVYWVELGENLGSEESKLRPCVIIQNQKGNENAPTTIVAPITNAVIKLPVAVEFIRGESPEVTGTIDCGQLRVVSKGRIKSKITKLTSGEQKKVDKALLISLGMYDIKQKLDQKNDKIVQLNEIVTSLTNEKSQFIDEIESLKLQIAKLMEK